MLKKSLFLFLVCFFSLSAGVEVGLDRLFNESYLQEIQGKKVGLITNHSALNQEGREAFDVFCAKQHTCGYTLRAAFAPEHGLEGKLHASAFVEDSEKEHIPIYSLHGKTRRPTSKMLEGLEVLVYDIQHVGSRCYTYEATLFYAMEEAAKAGIPVVVLDRPNPRGGLLVEGQLADPQYLCFFNHADVPFCPGMTIGELARYFNEEKKIGCDLKVVPMKGWSRDMSYEQTGLTWTPPSPNIPDAETTLVYPATIVLGETLEIVSVDLRGKKPFKRLGAPWISTDQLVTQLNQEGLPGVIFASEVFTPEWGKYEGEKCEGVLIIVTHPKLFQPLLTQYTIFDRLRELYPEDFEREYRAALKKNRAKACNYLTGSKEIINAIEDNNSILQTMEALESAQTKEFLDKRARYLLY